MWCFSCVHAGWDYRAVLNLHNALRARHQAPPLTWDDGLAAYAQSYADKCIFGQNPNLMSVGLGENLALGTSNLVAATQAWYDQVRGEQGAAGRGVKAAPPCDESAL
jgi:hypothetical protein